MIFSTIYRLYVWASSTTGAVGGYSERIIEYPFVIRAILSEPNLKRVLIVGCSGDLLTTLLPTLGMETYGIDVKFVPVVYDNFKFVRGDVRATKFPAAFFDAVVAVSTIEHITRSICEPQ